jgi:dGTPase
VTELEYRYADFPGLNLSYEVLESQAMHAKNAAAPEVARYRSAGQPLLEAQVVDAADSLAYDCHDVDDALSLGLITVADLDDVPFWRRVVENLKNTHKALPPLQFQPTAVRALIDWQVTDLLEQTRSRLKSRAIRSLEDVRTCQTLLVVPSDDVRAMKADLEKFLHARVYRHHRVMRMAHKGQRMLKMVFDELCRHPDQLPERYQVRVGATPLERVVCDYLAGMTDRFAQDEYLRLFQPYTPL